MFKALKNLLSHKPATTFKELEGTRHDGTKTYTKFYYLNDKKASPPEGFKDTVDYCWYDENNESINSMYGDPEGYLLHGKMQMAYSDGRVYMECELYYGLDHGTTTMWGDDGKIVYQIEYYQGSLIKTIIDNRPED